MYKSQNTFRPHVNGVDRHLSAVVCLYSDTESKFGAFRASSCIAQRKSKHRRWSLDATAVPKGSARLEREPRGGGENVGLSEATVLKKTRSQRYSSQSLAGHTFSRTSRAVPPAVQPAVQLPTAGQSK